MKKKEKISKSISRDDISKKRKKVDEKPCDELFLALAEQSLDIIVLVNREFAVTYENPALSKILGFKPGEVIGSNVFEYIHPDDLKLVTDIFNERFNDINAPVTHIEVRIRHKDGSWRTFEAMGSNLVRNNVVEAAIANLHDITERKKAEVAIMASEEKYRTLIQNIQDAIFIIKDGKIRYANEGFAKIVNCSVEELIGKGFEELVAPEDLAMVSDNYVRRMKGEPVPGEYEFRLMKRDGLTRADVRMNVGVINYEGGPAAFGTGKDITERKKIEKTLLFIGKAVESSSDAIGLSDPQGHHFYHNKAFTELFEYTPDELEFLGGGPAIYADKDIAREVFKAIMKGKSWNGELEMISKSGRKFIMLERADAIKNEKGEIVGLIGVLTDITERKKVEKAIRESEAKYRNIFENALEGIYQVTPEGRFITANTTLAQMAGYDSPENFMTSIKDIRHQLYVRPEDRDRFLKIMRTQGFVKGFEVEWYKKDGSIFWVVLNALAVRDEQGNTLYNEGLVEDITIRKQVEEQLKNSLENLREAVGTTINVLVSALESRDPYTVGHQSRTANLACAIAKEMGLLEDKIEGIHMAGVIHDIGKLSIPAEILTKPTKLTNLEFSLVKEHAQSGYEMLKNVKSPWPLAEIAHQHHERINGTGYPRNLRGEDILIEARIMAVADVVEAMASDRPYRASLGIDPALAEIEKNKGILYDVVVADACLRLFREKGYQLK